MVVIARTLFMRDLRGNWVFPRLVFAASSEAASRNLGRLNRFFLRRPANRVREFFVVLREHQSTAEILLAGFAVLTAFVRALTLLLLAVGSLYIALTQF